MLMLHWVLFVGLLPFAYCDTACTESLDLFWDHPECNFDQCGNVDSTYSAVCLSGICKYMSYVTSMTYVCPDRPDPCAMGNYSNLGVCVECTDGHFCPGDSYFPHPCSNTVCPEETVMMPCNTTTDSICTKVMNTTTPENAIHTTPLSPQVVGTSRPNTESFSTNAPISDTMNSTTNLSSTPHVTTTTENVIHYLLTPQFSAQSTFSTVVGTSRPNTESFSTKAPTSGSMNSTTNRSSTPHDTTTPQNVIRTTPRLFARSTFMAHLTISKPYTDVCTNTSKYVNELCNGLRISNPNDIFACLATALNGIDCPDGACTCASRRRLLQDYCVLLAEIKHSMQTTPLTTFMPEWVVSIRMEETNIQAPKSFSSQMFSLSTIAVFMIAAVFTAVVANALMFNSNVSRNIFIDIKIA